MAVQWSTPELATRYSVHVEELRDFFALQQLHFGSPEDIGLVNERIAASESFREDLTSMVRSIILHEGGVVPRANLLEIVAFAIGGRDMDQASIEVQEPMHQLLDFLMHVQRKPWNQPPGESRLQPAPLALVNRRVAEAGEASPAEDSASDETAGGEAVAGAASSAEGALVAAAGKVIPIARRQVTLSGPGMQQVGQAEYAVQVAGQAAARVIQPAARTFARPGDIYSRLTHVEADAAAARETLPEAEAMGMPSPVPEPLPPPPPPPLEAGPVLHAAAVPNAVAGAVLVRPPSALDLEPPSPSFRMSMHLPAGFRRLRMPQAALPTISAPTISAPRIALPAWSRAQSRIAVLSAGGAVLFLGVLVFASHRDLRASDQGTQQPGADLPGVAAAAVVKPAVTGVAAPAAVEAKPSADGPDLARPQGRAARRNAGYDDTIAKPYSTPVPGETAAVPSAATGAQATVIRPTVLPVSAPIASQPVARGPAGPIEPAPATASDEDAIPLPRRPANIAGVVMAANLLSGPAPGYPMLAKLAHVQGKVVLRAEVDRYGDVTDVNVVSGHRLLRGAAVDAVRRWRYRPYLVDGRPSTVFTTITLHFPPHG